ncbi:hypothetical protein PR003_g24763 [Phytophthora rubi]|uniref:Secreted protein n=1 Tax=Phytophthora rubi TaxID=129364 RepID=A0A6A3IUS1_9STRA|nr:hypothetical protein PR002_g24015 [Phytophthora rubi]KAE8983213.1 hypothetical protein PR001_g23508 [Phytophthora rubi]KAE9292414.1 hypothetical protein PR003_g24763 [Phytophthora rubi]
MLDSTRYDLKCTSRFWSLLFLVFLVLCIANCSSFTGVSPCVELLCVGHKLRHKHGPPRTVSRMLSNLCRTRTVHVVGPRTIAEIFGARRHTSLFSMRALGQHRGCSSSGFR